MIVLSLQITLEQPLLISQHGGDANSVQSMDYIPGSLLRGVLIGRYLRDKAAGYDLLTDAVAQRLFFSGKVRYVHGYLGSALAERSLPTPLALLQLKSADTETEEGYTAHNAAHADWDETERRDVEQGDVLKPLGVSYCTIDDTDLTSVQPKPGRIAVHVQRHRPKGRATGEPNEGAIFQYESLAEGQHFSSAVLIEDHADAALLQTLLAEPIAWIGRSRSANYGRIRIDIGKPNTTSWQEVATDIDDVAAGELLNITLLSDTLLRDQAGQPVGTLAQQPRTENGMIDDQILSAYLGFAVRIDAARTFSATTVIGGFNQTWRLPLPQQPALKAGSVLSVIPIEPVRAETLRALEQRGIGERRVEGFGRLAFQWLSEETYSVQRKDESKLQKPTAPLSPTGRRAAERMAQRLLDEQISLKLARYVANKSDKARNIPRNSQLGRIRALVRAAAQQGDLRVISNGLENFKGDSKRQIEAARLSDQRSLKDWLNKLTADPTQVWRELDFRPDAWPKVTEVQTTDTPALRLQTTLRLIEALLTGLHRTPREKAADKDKVEAAQ
jgi:CRISPR-associated protein Csx10